MCLMVSKFKLNNLKSSETKETISRTMEIASNYAGELSIEVIPLDKVELDPENSRELTLTLKDALEGISQGDPEFEKKKKDWKSLESLSKTIKESQLINPIFVYRYGNKCRLIAGERRTLASAIAGKKEIIARIASQRPVGTKLKVLQWVENNEREALSLIERVANIEAIISEYIKENNAPNIKNKVTAQLISDLTGMSNPQSRRYLLIINSEPDIKKAISDGYLENLKLAEMICTVENYEIRAALLEAARTGKTFDAIVKLKMEMEARKGNNLENKIRKRGNIKLGNIKTNVAKIIVKSLISSNYLDRDIIDKIVDINKNMKWDDEKAVEKMIKHMFLMLEKAG